jgi:hypothetical protein
MGLGFLLIDSQNTGRTDVMLLAIILLAPHRKAHRHRPGRRRAVAADPAWMTAIHERRSDMKFRLYGLDRDRNVESDVLARRARLAEDAARPVCTTPGTAYRGAPGPQCPAHPRCTSTVDDTRDEVVDADATAATDSNEPRPLAVKVCRGCRA